MRKLICLFFCLAVSTFAGAEEAAVLRVIDGDTLAVFSSESGVERRIRLIGIDCPETRANDKGRRDATEWGVPVDDVIRAGLTATRFVQARIGVTVTLDTRGQDAYGRTLAYVRLADGRSLNEMLLANGLAVARYMHEREPDYRRFEREAREQKRGFWKTIWEIF